MIDVTFIIAMLNSSVHLLLQADPLMSITEANGQCIMVPRSQLAQWLADNPDRVNLTALDRRFLGQRRVL